MPSLTWDAVNLDSDSLTGEDSLIDCSLLSNPTTDLLEEFAPIAISAPAHKGKCFPVLGLTCVLQGGLNDSWEFSLPKVFASEVFLPRPPYGKLEFVLSATVL